jgi:hypothetical protein
MTRLRDSISAKAKEAAQAWEEQQHELFAALDEVNTIAGAGVDAQFTNTIGLVVLYFVSVVRI